MTSYDRHATHDSPHRSGQYHNTRHAPFTGIAASESRVDLTATDTSDSNTSYSRPVPPRKDSTPYSPGMRSAAQRSNSPDEGRSLAQSGEIQMQSFSDGLPPPPPPSHSWKRIDHWLEEHYEELFDNIGEGCTQNDVNELEHELDCQLPMDVRESLAIHDGQERGGLPTGVIFGCMLLDCEEIVQEWNNWRKVNERYLTQQPMYEAQVPTKVFGASSSSAPVQASQQGTSKNWQEELTAKQDSQPSNAIQKVYSHPAWIPMARDWGGNCLAIDLAPGTSGQWGQVILMGRDYDCKYVVARSWGAFLASVADDITSNKVFVVEDSGELKLREFPRQGVEPAYLDILRWRADQKYGRKQPIKRPIMDPRRNSALASGGGPRQSPYGNVNHADSERGRSPNRLLSEKSAGKQPSGAKKGKQHVSSPLARVAEEAITGIKVHTEEDLARQPTPDLINTESTSPLVRDVPSNGSTDSLQEQPLLTGHHDDKENRRTNGDIGLGVKNINLNGVHETADEMKTVEI